MAKIIDYTGDAVKESISETMQKIIAYHSRYWKEGNELKVRDYVERLCEEELSKYMSDSQRDTLLSPLHRYVENPSSNKYTKIFERWLLQYGPYILTLALESVNARQWKNRYLVSEERVEQLKEEDFQQAMKFFKKLGVFK